MTEKYYAVGVAARLSKVKPSTIRRWISENKLYALTHNGRRYVTLQSVLDARDAPIRNRLLRQAQK